MTKTYRAMTEAELDFRNVYEHTCKTCGRVFYARGGAWASINYCSDDCRRQARNQRRRERARARWQRGDCEVCGRTLWDQVRRTRRYCSDQCRQWAYRRREQTGTKTVKPD